MAGRYCLPLPSRSSFWVADLRDDLIEFFIRAIWRVFASCRSETMLM